MKLFQKIKLHTLALVVALFVSASCSEIVATHGQVINTHQLNKIRIGIDDKESVKAILGSPSSIGTFADQRWYYITETTVDKPLNPNILKDRGVLVVEFNESQRVASLHQLDESDGHKLRPNKKTTPTQGQSLGVLDQLLENLGRGF